MNEASTQIVWCLQREFPGSKTTWRATVVADLFLDTWPYNAHTTAADALLTGLPIVTCKGDAFPARVAASLLTTMGHEQLVTESLDGYFELANNLANDPGRLKELREVCQPLIKPLAAHS